MTEPAADPDRIERERAFHDDTFAGDARAKADKFYAVVGGSHAAYARLTAVDAGDRVLEYGCGPGSSAFMLAEAGADVVGIDISPVAIAQAADEATKRGLTGLRFRDMNAEALAFDDGSFDLVCGSGILHHLDLDAAFSEIARVLRPGGHAVFLEPMGHNPAINIYRRLTPAMRTDDEHPLLMADIDGASRFFTDVDAEYYQLLALAAVPLRRVPRFDRLVALLDRADAWLFQRFPVLRRYAWTTVLDLYQVGHTGSSNGAAQ